MFSVIEKASGRWVGRVGPWQPEGWPGAEVGWGLERSAWGKGYATESAEAAIDWAFDALGWDDVIHCIDPGQRPSARVAERLGSARRGSAYLPAPFDNEPVDIWGQSRGNGGRGGLADRPDVEHLEVAPQRALLDQRLELRPAARQKRAQLPDRPAARSARSAPAARAPPHR